MHESVFPPRRGRSLLRAAAALLAAACGTSPADEAARPAPADGAVPLDADAVAGLTAEQFWIEVAPDSLRLAPGDTARLAAVGRSDDGTRWTIRVDWASDSGRVDAGGTFVAPATPGRYTVVATRSGDVQRDSATIVVDSALAVVAPPAAPLVADAAAGCTNEPAGYRRVANAPGNELPALQPAVSREGLTYFAGQIPTLGLVADASGPGSPGSALRVHFPAGSPGGESPSRWGTGSLRPNTGHLYVCLWLRYDAHWSTAGISTDKLFYVIQDDAPIWHAMVALGEDDQLWPHALLQYTDPGQNHNIGQTRDPRAALHGGGWHRLEVLWEPNTDGRPDGTFRQWVDGQLVADARDARWFPAGTPARWDVVWFDPIYAYAALPVPRDQSFYLDHVVISVR